MHSRHAGFRSLLADYFSALMGLVSVASSNKTTLSTRELVGIGV